MTTLVSVGEIQSAADRIRDLVVQTRLADVFVPSNDGSPGRRLALKCENEQPMGAFKIRGAANVLAQLSPTARAAGVLAYSSGNHGQAVALVAQHFGVPCVVVMPETAPHVKVEGVRRYGAEVIFAGTTSADRKTRGDALAAERGLTVVPPFDHPWIIAGAGTCGLEILEQKPNVDAIYVPVGGGGQLAGISAAVKALKPSVRVIGVEPSGAARMTAACAAGHPVRLDATASIADGLLTLQAGTLTFAHIQALVDDIVTVDDSEIADAVGWLFRHATIVAEPSGAASVAAVLKAATAIGNGTVAVVSGGNVSPDDHARFCRS